ncbi:hypothetical protein CSB20_06035 [bacterium DOLZORAL124_64_63]|nr:MAG: hypothetical protein CSB20_06035 [bacterium DOLZORAL124_64_63]
MKENTLKVLAGLALVLLPVAFVPAVLGCPVDAPRCRESFPEKKVEQDFRELSFVGYWFGKGTYSNIATTNEFLKGQVLGRLFGGNTTETSKRVSSYAEQRFIPLFTYSPRLLDGWAKIRASFELDWTWGDANYGAGGNLGGAYGADSVNLQTQNLFLELHPRPNLWINIGLQQVFDNVRVPWKTFIDDLTHTGYRLAFWGSDGTGVTTHYFFDTDKRLKAGFFQFYENNVEQKDDVVVYTTEYEQDLGIATTAGLTLNYLRDYANGEGGVSLLGQGLNSGLNSYNGVFNFNLGNEAYDADVFWLGTHAHHDPLLRQGDFGWGGFAVYNFGNVSTASRDVSISGLAANLRLAGRYGRQSRDQVVIDHIFTTGDKNNVSDGRYNGILTGNNWTSPGAVHFSHGLYLLLPHANVVNRFVAATIDIQNLGYGLNATSLQVHKELIPHKLKAKLGAGLGYATNTPGGMGSLVGSELNANLCWTPKALMDIELHAAYMWLGDFYDSPVVNGGVDERPENPWTVFATLKWISF